MASNLYGKMLEEAMCVAEDDGYCLKDEDLLAIEETSSKDARADLFVRLRQDTAKGHAVVIGLNPADARPGAINGDRTIQEVSKVLYGLGFSAFTMLNLYTYSTPDSGKLDEKVENSDCKARSKLLTAFEKYADQLRDAEAIFIVCGKTALGGDPRNARGNVTSSHAPAIWNMIDALRPFKDDEKTWQVRYERDNCSATWNVHPSRNQWRRKTGRTFIDMFPLAEYIAQRDALQL